MCVAAEPALVRAPQNTAVTRGSDVTFDCSSDVATAYITWFNKLCKSYVSTTDQCTMIYDGFNRRYTLTSVNNGTHVTSDLNVVSTQLTDAGYFVCVENVPRIGVQQTHSAQLIVVGNHIHFYTVFRKKHPLMFSLITPVFLCRFLYFLHQ